MLSQHQGQGVLVHCSINSSALDCQGDQAHTSRWMLAFPSSSQSPQVSNGQALPTGHLKMSSSHPGIPIRWSLRPCSIPQGITLVIATKPGAPLEFSCLWTPQVRQLERRRERRARSGHIFPDSTSLSLFVLNIRREDGTKKLAEGRSIRQFIKMWRRTSPVVQWLRICLPMQGTGVQALVQEDPTCHGATKPVHLEPMLHNKRSHWNEKPVHCNEE